MLSPEELAVLRAQVEGVRFKQMGEQAYVLGLWPKVIEVSEGFLRDAIRGRSPRITAYGDSVSPVMHFMMDNGEAAYGLLHFDSVRDVWLGKRLTYTFDFSKSIPD